MRFVALLLALSVCLPAVTFAQQQQYSSLKADAERLYAEGSYARARELYVKAQSLPHPESENRWIDFRLSDTLWRAESATNSADTSKVDAARKQLEETVTGAKRDEDRDRIWAEANESLGDFWWVRREARAWGAALPYYQAALDWWAGARDVEMARTRYLAIVWKAAEPPTLQPWEYYGYYGALPVEVLENALTISKTDAERAHAHYLIAMTLQRTGDPVQAERIPDEFEAALAAGRSAAWYDDSLYQYANFLANQGRSVYDEDAQQWRREVDYSKALELYRRLTTEFRKGQTRYYDEAVQQVENITKPTVSVGVGNIFLPGSEIQYSLAWRNAAHIDLALYKIDLPADATFASSHDENASNWINQVALTGRQPVKIWAKETGDTGDHRPGSEQARLDVPLELGAYVIEARSEGASARDLILVTDATVVVKTLNRQALAWFTTAADGAPLPNARVALWEPIYDSKNSTWNWRKVEGATDADGIAKFDLTADSNYRQILVTAAVENRQAFSYSYRAYYNPSPDAWRIYAYTDRPAYRPGETANWKLLARLSEGGQYSTPANRTIEYQINDPRGTKVSEGTATLNSFGSAWGSLELTDKMPLGEYQVTFWDEGRNHTIGSATIFRLEEYKLPEFKVDIKTPEENGKKKAFRLGDKVQVDIAAEYYFGGPVANANVEVLVYQNPFYRYWRFPHEYPWLYEDQTPYRGYYGRGQVVKRETLKTDVRGTARLTFDTPRFGQQDFEYTIEARVTDASRREIVAADTVRVTRQRYYVDAKAERTLIKPADEARVKLKALDANDRPVAVTGTVKITRDYWNEIWLDQKGREVSGEDLRKAKEKNRVFPPPTKRGDRPWTLKFQGYEHEEIATQSVQTDAEGNADVAFTPVREGYYRVAWSSREPGGPPIQAEAAVWAVTNATTDLGYRSGGLQILVEKDTFRAGQTAHAMIATPTNGRTVLFSVEGDDLYSYQVIRMTGTVKLLDIPVEERHIPNVFLNAAMVADNQLYLDSKEVVVPPVRNFLSVDVKADRDVYQPREQGTLTVTTRDADGNPVPAEVGLGFVDDSVYYIQSDYAGDPRQVFFGEKRSQRSNVQSTFQTKSYARLEAQQLDDSGAGPGTGSGVGVGGYGVAGARQSQDPFYRRADAPAPPPAAEAAKTEALAVDGRGLLNITPGVVGGKESTGGGQEPAVQVRSDFRSTVLWQPDVVTGPDGTATVKVTFPDSLTRWRATARAATAANQFGIATGNARTRRPLTMRLQAPRFFVAGDTVTLSAIANNNTEQPMTVSGSLVVEGLDLRSPGAAGPVTIPAGGEHRFDWTANATTPGPVKLTVTARGGQYADAMERKLTVYEHGIDKLVATSGKVSEGDVTTSLELPGARKPGTTHFDVQVSPSLAVTMLDAIPYLLDYPYGCTEQTMSRFLPAAIVAKTLQDLGIKPEDIENRMFGGIEPSTAAETHPNGKRPLAALDEIEKQGLARLYDFQHEDGGWGWWKDDASDHYMTAYVVWGLALARKAGVTVRDDALTRGADYLNSELVEEETNYDRQAWMLHALAVLHGGVQNEPAGLEELSAFDNLFTNRDRLSAYTRALLAIAAHDFKLTEQSRTLARNMMNGAQVGFSTASWGESRGWWHWSDGAIEATSFSLQALAAIDPANELIDPAMTWLVRNRRGAQWTNTRDTAIAILALNDYIRIRGELAQDLEYELVVNGQSVASRAIAAAEVVSAPERIPVDPSLLRDGANEIQILRKGGTAPIYYSAEARFFSLEEPVTPSSNEMTVRRQYYKLVGRQTLLKGYVYDRVLLGDNDSIQSGERVEVVLTIETMNDYEYLLFEDLKPAGFEAVEIRSGESLYAREPRADGEGYTGRTEWIYRELRDRKIALFVSRLPQGTWEIRYELRAEAPGSFHALPLVGQAMYVPEIRANGAEQRIEVRE